jgi:hypothetical protein
MVIHFYYPSSWDAETEREIVSWGPVFTTLQIHNQPRLHCETLSQEIKGWEYSSKGESLMTVSRALGLVPALKKNDIKIWINHVKNI